MSLFNKKKDYCSGVPDLEFGDCCKDHDEAYAKGGNRQDRKTADRLFKYCMRETKRDTWAAKMYYRGVRTFGWLPFFWNGSGRIHKTYRKIVKGN